MAQQPDRLFYGRIRDGRFRPHTPQPFLQYLASLEGQDVEAIVRVRSRRRTNPQNRWLWGYAYRTVLDAWGYESDEIPAASEELHEKLVGLCFGTHWDERMKKEVRNVRTSKLSTVEFSHYMEWLPRHLAQNEGIEIMLPDEVDYATLTPSADADEAMEDRP